ncbi:MAG: VOC family protein [Clostridia bacterium]|nr:VOC family protein [Clostridia bacterium]
MNIGEICFLTNDVPRLAAFYRQLLGIENGSADPVHQTLIAEETMLTIYNDGTRKENNNRNMCIAFTVENMDDAYQQVLSLGAQVLQPPARQPWGTVNMCFLDPDNNQVYLRWFPKE